MEMARLFDGAFKPSQSLSHERIRLVRANDLARCVTTGGKLDGFFRDGGFLHIGTVASLDPRRLATARHYHPEALTISAWPKGVKDRSLWMQETLLSGAGLVLAPRPGAKKGDPRVLEALITRFWRGLSHQGFSPGRALAEAQRAHVMGQLVAEGEKSTEKYRHPSTWGNLQLMLRRL